MGTHSLIHSFHSFIHSVVADVLYNCEQGENTEFTTNKQKQKYQKWLLWGWAGGKQDTGVSSKPSPRCPATVARIQPSKSPSGLSKGTCENTNEIDQAGLHPHSSLGLTPFYRDRPAQAQVAARNLHFISRELKSGACRRSPRASLQGEESPAEPCLREGQRGLGKNRQRCEASRSRQCPEWQRRKACQDRLKYRSDLRWGRGYCKSLGKAHII